MQVCDIAPVALCRMCSCSAIAHVWREAIDQIRDRYIELGAALSTIAFFEGIGALAREDPAADPGRPYAKARTGGYP